MRNVAHTIFAQLFLRSNGYFGILRYAGPVGNTADALRGIAGQGRDTVIYGEKL